MFAGISELIIHPDAFFARITKEKTSLIPPLVIVLAGACINIVGTFLLLALSRSLSSGKFEELNYVSTLTYYLIVFAIVPLLDWGILSVGFCCISHMISGKGSLKATFQNAGYGMLPWTILAALSAGYMIIFSCIHHLFPFVPITAAGSTHTVICFLIDFGFFLWVLYLWILAAKYTHEFTFRKAAGVTVIPVILLLLLDPPVWVFQGRYIFFGF